MYPPAVRVSARKSDGYPLLANGISLKLRRTVSGLGGFDSLSQLYTYKIDIFIIL